MKNNFKKNGDMRIRFETPEERTEIIRILEGRGFRIDEKLKKLTGIEPWDNRTFDINLKWKEYFYCVRPFIGAAMMSSGVRFYSAQEFFRIAESGFKTVPRFPVFHVPHDGREFPQELLASVRVPEEVFLRYHEKMRDTDMDLAIPEVYRGGHMCRSFPVSRLLCDVERFPGPEEVMEQYGMGFCYEKAYDGTVISRRHGHRPEYYRYYQAYHRKINQLCETHSRVFLIDLHSYHDVIIPSDFLVSGRKTPDLCIGADPRFTPPAFLDAVRSRFEEIGLTVDVNYPYSGCYVPEKVENGSCPCDFIGLMLEFHRRAYMDESGYMDFGRIEIIQETIRKIIRESCEF